MFHWILLQVVELHHLNHPNEFAAVASPQEHTLSVMRKVLVSTQGAEDTGDDDRK